VTHTNNAERVPSRSRSVWPPPWLAETNRGGASPPPLVSAVSPVQTQQDAGLVPESQDARPPPAQRPQPLFAGWVRFQRHGWQCIISPCPEWLARLDLAEYLPAVGDAAIGSRILPDGERP
jgi:hypothetical protein